MILHWTLIPVRLPPPLQNRTKLQYLMYLHMKVCFLLKQYRDITIENQRVKGGGLIYLRASH